MIKRLKITLIMKVRGWKRITKFTCTKEVTSRVIKLSTNRFQDCIQSKSKVQIPL